MAAGADRRRCDDAEGGWLDGDRRSGVDGAAGPTAGIVPRRAAMTTCRRTMGTRLRASVALLALVACACSALVPRIGDVPAPARQPSVTTDLVYGTRMAWRSRSTCSVRH